MHFPRVPVLIRQRRAVGLELDRVGVLGVNEEVGAPVEALRGCDDLRLVEQLRVAYGYISWRDRPNFHRHDRHLYTKTFHFLGKIRFVETTRKRNVRFFSEILTIS